MFSKYRRKGGVIGAVFVDGNSASHMVQQSGWDFDPKKLLEYFIKDYEVTIYKAYWYLSVRDEDEQADRTQFLEQSGFVVRRKLMKEVINYYNQMTYYKQNTTMEMVIDMFNEAEKYDLAIIVSGDGDLERAVEILRCKGIRIFVVSTEGVIAKELRNASDTYIDLNSIRNLIIKEKRQILSAKRHTKQLL